MPLLSFDTVSVAYGGVRALRELSLHVDAGELVCLVGANGAGKSTAMRALLGLVPWSGRIEFDGTALQGLSTEAIVGLGIGIVPEGRRVFPGLNVLENLKAGSNRQPRATMAERVAELYAVFPRLAERSRQMAWSLSGGEQQMLAVARALMGRPRLLVLDEPSLGLAPLVIKDVFDAVGTIARHGTAILVLEQNVHTALAAADRGYVLENGHLVLQGAAKDLLHHPKVKAAFLGGD